MAVRPSNYTFDMERLAALEQFQILDTPPEKGFDDIVELATGICATPVALVSLVAGDRQWFKARIGFDSCQTDLSRSVCAHALVEPDILEIEDLTLDARSRDNALVAGAPNIRFYAGAPMRTAGGHVIGSLCVIDTKPRPGGLEPAQRNALRALARQVITQLELRSAVAERDALLLAQKKAEERRHGLLRLGDDLRDAISIVETTRAAAMIAGQTVGANRAAFARFDATGEHLTVEPDWTLEGVASITGTHRMADYGTDLQAGLLKGEVLVIDDVLTDPRTADHQSLLQLGIRSLVNVPIRENERTVAALIVHAGEPRSWPEEELSFLRNVADRVEVAVARLEAESQQRLLNSELSHRMKNTMALVQAIASQTLRSVPDQAPVRAFSERVLAMSIAHDILLQDSWKAAQMGPIIDAVACTFADAGRFDIRGPSVTLGSRATLALSLLVHELTTNALKYGALSNDAGRVQVTWDLPSDGSELRLTWRETGGPPVEPPSRKGLGTKLIRLGSIGTGGAELHYQPQGFEADFTAPLAELHS